MRRISTNLEVSVGTTASPPVDPEAEMEMDMEMDMETKMKMEMASLSPATEDNNNHNNNNGHYSQPYTPPPHIAARFYRPTQHRRRDSAASSRRNSISSAQSLSSHGFGNRNEPQSKYIAQQLRRASILEDRKARLADRAAHAEKVRLRAALAKAAPQKSSTSEERALAAAQARERNLAEIVAACAEEVKRAKAVAENTKEKREQELRKLKIQMEERLAEAERRREEMLSRLTAKRVRGQSMTAKKSGVDMLPDVEEQQEVSPMSEEVSADKIQWWWRGVLRKKTVTDFAQLGLSIDGVSETSYEKVVDLLTKEHVLMATARVLRLCGLKEGEPDSVDQMMAIRTFLSAFLILGHPTQVLSNKDGKGEQEQDLVGKARDLLICFQNVLSGLTSFNNYTPSPVILEAMPEIFATFHNAFIAWKARDSDAMIEVMLLQFIELDAILETVNQSTEDAVSAVYRQSVKDNQVLLMVRIKRLAGAVRGKNLIRDAVREARKARASKKAKGDTKPRTADHALGGAEGSAQAQETAENTVATHLEALAPPSPSPQGEKVPIPLEHMSPYPPFLPDNRVIVHELAINREYRIEFERFQEQHEMRMEPLLNDLKSGGRDEQKEFHYLIVMAHYIKDRLQRLVKPESSMYAFIGEILDTEVAQRQFMAGTFSYDRFFSSMGSLLPKLCAPVRDEQVKELAQVKLVQDNVVDRLEALISFIDIMLYDYANYLMQVAAPNLLEHASSYEAKQFSDDLTNGTITLDKAEASWRAARAKVHAEAARRDPEGVNLPKSRPTPDKIYWQMLLDEFTQPSPSETTLPEPLALDSKRRARLGLQTLRIITAGAILLQCKNILKRDVRSPWKTEAGRITTILENLDDPKTPLEQSAAVDGIMVALESGRSMPAATKTQLRALATNLLAAAADAKRLNSEPRDPVLRLLFSRVKGHVLARLQAGSAKEKVKATSVAGEKLAGLGLPEFVQKVREIVEEMTMVGAVDREAHGGWWEGVAEKVDKEAAAAAGGR